MDGEVLDRVSQAPADSSSWTSRWTEINSETANRIKSPEGLRLLRLFTLVALHVIHGATARSLLRAL